MSMWEISVVGSVSDILSRRRRLEANIDDIDEVNDVNDVGEADWVDEVYEDDEAVKVLKRGQSW